LLLELALHADPFRQLTQILLFLPLAFLCEHAAFVRVIADAQAFGVLLNRGVLRRLVIDQRQTVMLQSAIARTIGVLAIASKRVLIPFVDGIATIIEGNAAGFRLRRFLGRPRSNAQSQFAQLVFQFVAQLLLPQRYGSRAESN
jgi:hypothetical protein